MNYFLFYSYSNHSIVILGDTLVSILKRYASIKRSGNIMPGHGGIIDRMDSFIAVFFFWYSI